MTIPERSDREREWAQERVERGILLSKDNMSYYTYIYISIEQRGRFWNTSAAVYVHISIPNLCYIYVYHPLRNSCLPNILLVHWFHNIVGAKAYLSISKNIKSNFVCDNRANIYPLIILDKFGIQNQQNAEICSIIIWHHGFIWTYCNVFTSASQLAMVVIVDWDARSVQFIAKLLHIHVNVYVSTIYM